MGREDMSGDLEKGLRWGSSEVIQFFKFCGALQRDSNVTWAYYSFLSDSIINDMTDRNETASVLNLWINESPLTVEEWPDVDAEEGEMHIGLTKADPDSGEAKVCSIIWLAKINRDGILDKNPFFTDDQINMLVAQKAEQSRLGLPSVLYV